jgi:hypothetical protein
MKRLRVDLPDDTALRLVGVADRLGMPLEELIRISLEEKLARLDERFLDAAQYVLNKHEQLYQRLD